MTTWVHIKDPGQFKYHSIGKLEDIFRICLGISVKIIEIFCLLVWRFLDFHDLEKE